MVQSGDSPHDKEVSRPVDVEALVFPVGDASWRSALLRSTVAVSCAGAGLLLRWLLDPLLGPYFPLAPLFLAAAVAAWAGGYTSGALAAVLSYLACDLLLEPRDHFTSAASLETLIGYTVFSAIIVAFAGGIRASRRRDRAANAQLRDRQLQLEQEIAIRIQLQTQHADAVQLAQRAREEAEAAQRQLQLRVEELETLMDLIPIGIYVAHDRECPVGQVST